MILVLLGPPGAGKGTQAKLLAEKLSIPHVSAGDALRAEIAAASELGKKIQGIVSAGELVPDELVDAVVEERLGKKDCGNGFILDGYPRTIGQAKALDAFLEKNSLQISFALNFVAEEEELVKRLSSRLTCRNCGTIFNLLNHPPKKKGVCDACGGELYERDDQKPEVIRKRFEEYAKKTEPLIKYYEEKKLLKNVDTKGSIKENFGKTLEAIGIKE